MKKITKIVKWYPTTSMDRLRSSELQSFLANPSDSMMQHINLRASILQLQTLLY